VELSRDQVMQIAELAKLDLTEGEIENFGGQLSAILGFFERLQQVNTDTIPPTASVLPLHSVMRSDEVRPSLTRVQATANAPDAIEGQFRVSAVLDE
jgi:aspartyl-tRNA(Asn)/glutamyl-tRNA(Gln) amidotransferase subunit C